LDTVLPFQRGDGGGRTLVQTRNQYAFYMLIPAFGFRALARPGPPTNTLVWKFHAVIQTLTTLFPIFCASLIQSPQDVGLGRRLVAVVLTAIKLTYCTSVRLQEHSYSRQLNFWSPDYSASHQRTACLHTASARCQNRSSPYLRCNPVRSHRKN